MSKPLRTSPPDSVSSLQVQAPRSLRRRTFSAAEKQSLLRAADACAHGEIGRLLRKEGIYLSQLTDWRRQLAQSGSAGLGPKKTGPVSKCDAKDREIMVLHSKVKKLERELGIVNGLVELQKKKRRRTSQSGRSEVRDDESA